MSSREASLYTHILFGYFDPTGAIVSIPSIQQTLWHIRFGRTTINTEFNTQLNELLTVKANNPHLKLIMDIGGPDLSHDLSTTIENFRSVIFVV